MACTNLVYGCFEYFLPTLALFLSFMYRRETSEEDDNPVYGLYEFADGSEIDQGRTEAVDENDYYA